jgi:DNA-directed RNA polymerase beta subunit
MLDYQGRPLPDIIKDLERKQGCIEYLDIEEENTMYIAMKEEDITGFHTHLEIHPSTAFSVVTHIVPFAHHNQAPRVYFHAAQSKQAIGVYTTNFSKRFDTMGYIQHYPQKRIVTTRGSFYNGNNSMPNGTNVIVAVATYTGWNQEDGIILNKSSVDRGLFQITAYKTMTASEKTLNNNERVVFANPIKMRTEGKLITGNKHANYTLLGDDGIIKEESYVPRGQEAVVLGMVHVRDKLKEVKNGVFTEYVKEEMYHETKGHPARLPRCASAKSADQNSGIRLA